MFIVESEEKFGENDFQDYNEEEVEELSNSRSDSNSIKLKSGSKKIAKPKVGRPRVEAIGQMTKATKYIKFLIRSFRRGYLKE